MKKSEELKQVFIGKVKKDHWKVSVTTLDDTITDIAIRGLFGVKIFSLDFDDTFNFDPKHNIMFGEVDHVSLSGKEVISLSKLLQQAVYLLKDLGKLSKHGEA